MKKQSIVRKSSINDSEKRSISISLLRLNSIKNISSKILKNLKIRGTIHLNFKGVIIKVIANSGELIKELELYYSGFCMQKKEKADITIHALEGIFPEFDIEFLDKKPEPGKSRIKEQYFDITDGRIVKKILTGMIFIFGDGINIAVGECIKNSNQVVNFINNRYMEYMLNKSCLLFHSAAVGTTLGGAAICGFAGAGKSTLAIKLLEKGFSFISNDRLLAKKENFKTIIYGVPKLPRINPGTIISSSVLAAILTEEERDRYLKLELDQLWKFEKKYDLPIDQIFGKGKFIAEAKLKGLFILNWKRDGMKMNVQKISLDERKELFPTFVKSPGLFYDPKPYKMPDKNYNTIDDQYLMLLSDCDVFEFTGGIDFDQAAVFISDFLNEVS